MAIDLSSPGEGYNQQSDKYCAWCGKPNATSVWGGEKVHYCNYRCATANRLGIAIFVSSVLFFTLGLIIVSWPRVFWATLDHFNIGRWQAGSMPFLVAEAISLGAIVTFAFITAFLGYATFIGYKMRKEKGKVM